MEFFKGLGNKISHTSQEAIKKTKEIADITKLNGEISAEEKKINNTYQMIGQKYFELHANLPEEEFVELVISIKNSMNKIEKAKEDIRRLKGKRVCPQCSAVLEGEAPFCPMCGAKLPVIEKPIVEETKVEVIEEKNTCKSCGEELEDGAMFCQSCGDKVN